MTSRDRPEPQPESTPSPLPPITCISSLIASCPPLLGFEPGPSLICLSDIGSPNGGRLVARTDLVAQEQVVACAGDLAASLLRAGTRRATLVLWVESADDLSRSALPSVELAELLAGALADGGAEIERAVATNGRVWWGLLCPTAPCCPEEGHAVDARVVDRIRAEYALAGYAPLPGRSELEVRLRPDPVQIARTAQALGSGVVRPGSLVARRRRVDQLWAVLCPGAGRPGSGPCEPGGHPTDRASAWADPGEAPGRRARGGDSPSRAIALQSLADQGLRDAVIRRFARTPISCRSCWQRSLDSLTELVRAAPPGLASAPATLLGLVAWLAGEGALANVACDLALRDRPDHTMAALTAALVSSGVSPQEWRASMEGLSEDMCLTAVSREAGAA